MHTSRTRVSISALVWLEAKAGVEVKSMIDLVLVRRDMLRYMQDVRAVRDHHVVLCKVRLVGAWIKKRGVVVGARRIRSKKLREH